MVLRPNNAGPQPCCPRSLHRCTPRRTLRSAEPSYEHSAGNDVRDRTAVGMQAPGPAQAPLLVDIGSTVVMRAWRIADMPGHIPAMVKAAARVFAEGGPAAELQAAMQLAAETIRTQELDDLQAHHQNPEAAKAQLPESGVTVSDTVVQSGVDDTRLPVRTALLDDGHWLLLDVPHQVLVHLHAYGLLHYLGEASHATKPQASAAATAAAGDSRHIFVIRLADGFDQLVDWAETKRVQYGATLRLLVPDREADILAVLVALAICDSEQKAFPLATNVGVTDSLQALCMEEEMLQQLAGGICLRFGTEEQPALPDSDDDTEFLNMVAEDKPHRWWQAMAKDLPTLAQGVNGFDPVNTYNTAAVLEEVNHYINVSRGAIG